MVGLSAAIVAVTRESPRILTIARPTGEGPGGEIPLPDPTVGPEAALRPDSPSGAEDPSSQADVLPFGPLDPESDRTLELTLRRWVREQTGLELGYVEQLYTFGDRGRAPGTDAPRVISVAYLALVREDRPSGPAHPQWRDWYTFFPWEDWRAGQPEVIRSTIGPALDRWAKAASGAARADRQERASIAFGIGGAGWDADRVLERYELLYELGLVEEARRTEVPAAGAPPSTAGAGGPLPGAPSALGRPMAMDHRRILATGLGRLRGKLRYRPVVFELVPETFTLLRLQRVVEALVGQRLHKQNFRRLVERGGLVEGTGKLDPTTGGRPAELFRFRREVLRERRAPGVVVPGSR